MSKLQMDLSKFKKVSSDESTTTLRHADGHEIRVAHRALTPKVRKDLLSLPQHFSDGGEVDDRSKSAKKLSISKDELNSIDSAPIPDYQISRNPADSSDADLDASFAEPAAEPPMPAPPPPAMTGAQREQNPYSIPDPSPGPVPASVASPAPQQPGIAPQPQAPQAMPTDPYGSQAYTGAYMQGLNEQKRGIQQGAAAEGQQGRMEAAAAQEQTQFLQKAQQDYHKHYDELQSEYKSVLNDVQNQHINPNHYQENMSTGSKVAAAIGLLLGGIGSGLTHTDNLASKYLDNQIERDVESQKANLGKSENLLSANLKQFGNLQDATQMTQAMQMGIYSAKLKEAAGNTADPLARARALQKAGELDQQAAPILSQLAVKKSLVSGMEGANPAQKVRMLSVAGIIPKGEEEKVYKELGDAQGMYKARDNVLSAMDQVSKLNTLSNRLSNPMQSKSQIDAIWDPMVASLSKETAGRFTEQDSQFLNSLKPEMRDSPKTIKMKIARANALVSQKMHFPMLDAYGLNPGGSARYDNSGNNKFQMGPPVPRK